MWHFKFHLFSTAHFLGRVGITSFVRALHHKNQEGECNYFKHSQNTQRTQHKCVIIQWNCETMRLKLKNFLNSLTHPSFLAHTPNKWDDWSCPLWCQSWWWPVWQQSISRLSRAVCQPSEVSVQQHEQSGADSAGWGTRLQHNICMAPFSLSAVVL